MNVHRRHIIAAGVLVLGAATSYSYWRSLRDGGDGYLTEIVRRGSIASTVTASGTVNPVTTVQVGTYVSGPIKAIYADFNSHVEKGELVAKIDPAPFQVKVKSSEASVANAKAKVLKDKADLAFKKLMLRRNQELLGKNLIAQSDLDNARNDYDQAVAQLALDEAAVQRSEADLEAARINLAYTDIRSPVDGIVVSRNVDVGQTVAASFQTPTLFLIAQDLTKMQVNANVSEADIGPVVVGQAVMFRVDAYPDRDFKGKVVQVRNAPVNVQNVITYDVVSAVDNPRLELRPGMTATVTITTARRDDVLRVPLRALRFHPAPLERGRISEPGAQTKARGARAPSVFVLQPDGRLRRVDIKTGIRDDRYAEVVSGELKEEEVVAVGYKRAETSRASGQRAPSFASGRRR